MGFGYGLAAHLFYVFEIVLAYADDLTCIVRNKKSIKHIFKEYKKMSMGSGLILNAEKTEIIRLGTASLDSLEICYRGCTNKIVTLKEGRLNGIYVGSDMSITKEMNFNMVKSNLII